MARNPKYTYNPCDDCKYSFSYNNQECPICKMCELKYFSAEYVAQKSKVDRLERICNSYALQYDTVKDQQAVIDKAKTEVAREIFEEIAEKLEGLFDFFRQDGCIRESSAIMLAISEIAELKKKYTEGEPNGQNIKE